MLKHILFPTAALILSACAQSAPPTAPTAPTAAVVQTATTGAPAVTLVVPATQTAVGAAASVATAPQPSATPVPAAVTPTPEPTVAPTVAPTAAPAVTFVQLTSGGCCVQPFFSADGARVLFLDRPSAGQPPGIYGVPVAAPLSQPVLVTERLGPFSRNLLFSANLINGRTTVEGPDGQAWTIDNGGRAVSFSPDATQIIWSVSAEAGGFDVRRSDVWLAKVDGSGARRVATRFGGGPVAWLSDGQRLLLGGRPQRGDDKPTLSLLDLRDGSVRDLFSAERWRGVIVSPDDRHVLYFVAQAREDGQGGVYLFDLEQAGAQPRRLDFFGAYRWRDGTHVLYIPLKLNAPSNELWQFDITTGKAEMLIEASDASPFKIGNGDWDVSADGSRVVFVNARDRNLWLATLKPLR